MQSGLSRNAEECASRGRLAESLPFFFVVLSDLQEKHRSMQKARRVRRQERGGAPAGLKRYRIQRATDGPFERGLRSRGVRLKRCLKAANIVGHEAGAALWL